MEKRPRTVYCKHLGETWWCRGPSADRSAEQRSSLLMPRHFDGVPEFPHPIEFTQSYCMTTGS